MNYLDYCNYLTDNELPILQKLRRETHQKILMPRQLSGHYQGVLLQMISKIARPRFILEIGTFTGYSAICLAQGLSDDGLLVSIEKNDELQFIAQKYFNLANLQKKIKLIIGDALEIIPKIDLIFDLVFIDGDKRQYLQYYQTVFEKINTGGIILIDNVFWNGKIFENVCENDLYTKGVIELNEFIKNDDRVEKITLPIRDGLTIVRKK